MSIPVLDEIDTAKKAAMALLNIPEGYFHCGLDDMSGHFWMKVQDEVHWGEEDCDEYSHDIRSDIWPSTCGKYMSMLVQSHFSGDGRYIMVFETKLEELDI